MEDEGFAEEKEEADQELDDIVNDLPESNPETLLDDAPLKKRVHPCLWRIISNGI
jgi:hypothetical protein